MFYEIQKNTNGCFKTNLEKREALLPILLHNRVKYYRGGEGKGK